MNTKQIMKELEGQEISSMFFEDVIGISEGKIIHYGYTYLEARQVTKKVAQILLHETFENEFGEGGWTLKEEFGKDLKFKEPEEPEDLHEETWKVIRKNLWKQGYYGEVKMSECV